MSAKRDIFSEVVEGLSSIRQHGEGKITLRTTQIDMPTKEPLPKMDAETVCETREQLHMSQAVFARYLRINERTLQSWEQGRASPNAQASLLMQLVRNYPETIGHIASVAKQSLPAVRNKRKS